MHLPEAKRRTILYATTAVLVTSVALAAFTQLDRPLPQPGSPKPPTVASVRSVEEAQVEAESKELAAKAPAAAGARNKVEVYQVQEGDTIGTIAERFGLKSDTILSANDMDDTDLLQIGQELSIPAVDGLVHVIKNGDALWDLASDYDVTLEEIIAANGDIDPSNIRPGQTLIIPGGTRPVRRSLASRGTTERPSSRLVWPTVGPTTDSFGWRIHPVYGTSAFHDGVDLDVSSGTPLNAAGGGTVILASRYGGYGLTVKIDHGGGLVTLYAHMSQIDVSVGERVAAGDPIGYSGNTGVTTGPHLHFSLYQNGSPIDPMPWLP